MTPTADPDALGFDAGRLARIDDYLSGFVERGEMPGWELVVTRHGEVAHTSVGGVSDIESQRPLEPDQLYRIYSMTKPITSVAAMILYERGAFQLSDPISRWLPEFAHTRVYAGGSDLRPATVPARSPITVAHLLTHTSGLTYDFFRANAVDAIYRTAGVGARLDREVDDLAGYAARLAELPLLFQPGSEWGYSRATDVLGALVEVVGGMPFDEFVATEITGPLKMDDTRFGLTDETRGRVVRLHAQTAEGLVTADKAGLVVDEPALAMGGQGLISSAADYHRFTQMLRRRGELDGIRVLGSRTVDFMTMNHLPGGADLESFGRPLYSETPMRGSGFGLGFSVDLTPPATGRPGSAGTYAWGGAASTAFYVDPVEDLTVLFFTQVMPLSPLALRTGLRQMVFQALVD